MARVAIICEYNPFHKGHKYQLDTVRKLLPDSEIISIMSPSFVQRGQPAVFDKFIRGECAVSCGADLAVSMPQVLALLSAEGFAEGGVKVAKLLGADTLAFGVENDDTELLVRVAGCLISPEFEAVLKKELEASPELSFPIVRQKALSRMIGDSADVISTPNNILAVEYIKAIIKNAPEMKILPIKRIGNAHSDLSENGEFLSASAIRELMKSKSNWKSALPHEVLNVLKNANQLDVDRYQDFLYTAVTISDYDRIYKATGNKELSDTIYSAVKRSADYNGFRASLCRKKFTQTKIDRCLINILLNLSADEFMHASPEYITLLAMNMTGRKIISETRNQDTVVISRYGDSKKLKGSQIKLEQLADRIWARCTDKPCGEDYFVNKTPVVRN